MASGCEAAVVPEITMSRECPFCGSLHESPYVDELEAAVMACREKTTPDRRGTLEAWGDRETLPVRPEAEAFGLTAA